MPATRKALIAVLMALVTLVTITTVPAFAETDAIQEAKDREVLVKYTGLVVVTMAAAEATGNEDFWDAATDAAATSEDPVGTLLRLMEATDWADEAITIWQALYGGIGLEEAYALSAQLYAELLPA